MARKPYLEFSVDDRHASSRMYGRLLRNGTITRVDKSGGCAACFMTKGPIEEHREDYSSLENDSLVVLCYRCHRVLHMRDRWPDEWDFYREKVRLGWQWGWSKSIGPVAGDMRSCSLDRARLVNEPRDRTPLDDINDGVLLKGTPEDRRARLDIIHGMDRDWKRTGGSAALF